MSISERIHLLQQQTPKSITLLAVSKGQPSEAIVEAFDAGLRHFGESYWQEAQIKMAKLQHLPITWHFIGPIQSNKAAVIAQHFDWVHSLCSEKIANLLSSHRPNTLPALKVCLQVNLDNETSKQGVTLSEVGPLASYVLQCPNLQLRGLMAIPKPELDERLQYQSLRRLYDLLHQTNHSLNLSMDTLSMGMSTDRVAAIEAGSTILRLGQAIFGERV